MKLLSLRILAASLSVLLAACDGASAPRLLVTGAPALPDDRPIQRLQPEFTSSSACKSCHAAEYESWHASFHRTMTQQVGPDTVLAPWEGELHYGDDRFVLERRGDGFWVELDDPEWRPGNPEFPAPLRVWRQMVLSTGSHNFQAFWFPSGVTRKLYMFTMCYRIDEGLWMPMDAAFIDPPTNHRQPRLPRWNLACLKCHVTKPVPAVEEPEMDTTVTEFGIACEACHGPGEAHVAANQNPLRRYEQHLAGDDVADATIVNPLRIDPKRSSDVCGQCHGITEIKEESLDDFNDKGYSYDPGEDLFEQRNLVTAGDEYFWPDGQVRVSGRELNAHVRSPCYLEGEGERTLTCFSCHELHPDTGDTRPLEEWRVHQLKPAMRTNEGCTQCHAELAAPEARDAHSHHSPESVSCHDCHMPHTVWGLLKAIRSHEISTPSVQESLKAERPNACNLCHLDRSLGWTAKHLEEWYGTRRPQLSAPQRSQSAAVHWILKGDAGLRALIAWHMGWEPAQRVSGTDWMPPYLATLLDDAYDAVRFRAERTLRALPGYDGFTYDFVGKTDQFAAARRWVEERWKASGPHEDDPAVLIEGGKLLEDEFQRLLGLRDHKVMLLAE
jgi:cytochrome c554/c'-like protein